MLRRLGIPFGMGFAVTLVVLLWRGPIWTREFVDNLALSVAMGLLFVAVMSLALGEPAPVLPDEQPAVAQQGPAGLVFGRIRRGVVLTAVGVAAGGLAAGGLGLALAATPSVRLTYARNMPYPALGADYLDLAPSLLEWCEEAGSAPADLEQLTGRMRSEGVEPRYSVLGPDDWRDAWGRTFRYRSRPSPERPCAVTLYSAGADGVDDGGSGDDVTLSEAIGHRHRSRLDALVGE